jgi:catalase
VHIQLANIPQLGVQIMNEDDQLRFGFDLLDPTKIVPEEYVPVTKLGKIQLNRNPRNYFAETEQVMVRPLRLNTI